MEYLGEIDTDWHEDYIIEDDFELEAVYFANEEEEWEESDEDFEYDDDHPIFATWSMPEEGELYSGWTLFHKEESRDLLLGEDFEEDFVESGGSLRGNKFKNKKQKDRGGVMEKYFTDFDKRKDSGDTDTKFGGQFDEIVGDSGVTKSRSKKSKKKKQKEKIVELFAPDSTLPNEGPLVEGKLSK